MSLSDTVFSRFRAKTGQYLGFPDSPGAASFDRNAEDPAHLDGDEERLVVASSAQPSLGKRDGDQQRWPFGGEGVGVLQRFGEQHPEHSGGHQASVMFGVEHPLSDNPVIGKRGEGTGDAGNFRVVLRIRPPGQRSQAPAAELATPGIGFHSLSTEHAVASQQQLPQPVEHAAILACAGISGSSQGLLPLAERVAEEWQQSARKALINSPQKGF